MYVRLEILLIWCENIAQVYTFNHDVHHVLSAFWYNFEPPLLVVVVV